MRVCFFWGGGGGGGGGIEPSDQAGPVAILRLKIKLCASDNLKL